MTNILLGFVGALALVILLFVGGATGWFLHKAFMKHTSPVAQPPEEKERKRLEAEQEAFRLMQNYSTETAYGLNNSDEFQRVSGGDGR